MPLNACWRASSALRLLRSCLRLPASLKRLQRLLRARLEANGWLVDAVAKFGEPAAWDLADVIAWGKGRKAEIDAAAAKVAAFGESGGEE